jgi:activator of HSP90 ATPase
MDKVLKIGTVTSESVKKHTKKDWAEWVKILNLRSHQNSTHQQLVQVLKKDFKLTTWWQQEVARGYKVAIGKRMAFQTLKGTYTTTATKSVTAKTKDIFNLLISEEGQALWLNPLSPVIIQVKENFECEGGIFGEFRTVSSNKQIRMTWINEDWPQKSTVQLNLYTKPKNKCMIVINHIDLPTLKAKTQMHTHWRNAVDQVADFLAKY